MIEIIKNAKSPEFIACCASEQFWVPLTESWEKQSLFMVYSEVFL